MHIETPRGNDIEVKAATVGCDGGGGQLGHPMIYLDIATKGEATCPYCSKRYRLAAGIRLDHGH